MVDDVDELQQKGSKVSSIDDDIVWQNHPSKSSFIYFPGRKRGDIGGDGLLEASSLEEVLKVSHMYIDDQWLRMARSKTTVEGREPVYAVANHETTSPRDQRPEQYPSNLDDADDFKSFHIPPEIYVGKQLEAGAMSPKESFKDANGRQTSNRAVFFFLLVAFLATVIFLTATLLAFTTGNDNNINTPSKTEGGQQAADADPSTVLPTNSPTTNLRTPVPTPGVSPPNTPSTQETSSPTAKPTAEPVSSSQPTIFQQTVVPSSGLTGVVTDLQNLLAPISPDRGAALLDETSLQFQALLWLAGAQNQFYRTYGTHRLVQRYVLAVLYLSTNGGQWTASNGWLTEMDECTWYFGLNGTGPACSSEGFIAFLDLAGNHVHGPLPPEIAMLSDSLVRIDMRNNTLTGTIPTALGLLTNLFRLELTRNQFVGALPSELGTMSKLVVLGVGRNLLNGTIPKELGLLQTLDTLGLEHNEFMGPIPIEFGKLTSLELVALDANKFSGILPPELESWTKLESLSLNGNGFVGIVPRGLCSASYLAADCLEVSCDCCRECCVDAIGCYSN